MGRGRRLDGRPGSMSAPASDRSSRASDRGARPVWRRLVAARVALAALLLLLIAAAPARADKCHGRQVEGDRQDGVRPAPLPVEGRGTG